MAKERWFEPGNKTGWRKSDSTDKRRRTILRSRHGDLLATARALGSLANVTKDKETHQKARVDSLYFYHLYAKKKRR